MFSIRHLSSLKRLDLRDNQLTVVDIQCRRLEYLHLKSNPILKVSLGQMPNLSILSLDWFTHLIPKHDPTQPSTSYAFQQLSTPATFVQYFLTATGNINTVDYQGRTLLHHICLRNETHLIEPVIEAGADYAALDNYNLSPYALALKNCQAKAAEFMLARGFVDFDSGYGSFGSYLHLAIQRF